MTKLSYRTTPLGNIVGDNGLFTDGDWVESKDQDQAGEVRLIQLADIGINTYLDKSNRRLTSATAKRLRCTFLREGDILIARMPDPIGRACIFPGDHSPCVTVVDVCIVRPSEDIADARYVVHFLNSTLARDNISTLVQGATRQRISRSNLESIGIPLPPLDEQRRIAAILDQADDLRRKRRETLGRLQELKAVYFQRTLVSSDAPFGTIDDFTESTQYGTSAKAGDEGAFPILRMGNLTYEGDLVSDNLKFIDLEPNDIEKYTVRPGDILFNRTNSAELVGKTAIVHDSGYAFAGYLVRLRTNRKADPEFISGYLNSKRGKAILKGMCKAIIGMANINAKELRSIPIPLIPLDIQRAFAARVAEIDKLKAHHRAHLARLDALFASLQHRAFRGDLSAPPFSRAREKAAAP